MENGGGLKIPEEILKEHRIAAAFGSVVSRAEIFASLITGMIDKLGIEQLLDYGCGNGELVKHLKPDHELTIQRYDPAIPEFTGDPVPMQMVVAIDVLNILPEDYIAPVLNELKLVTDSVLFVAIGVSEKTPEFWLSELSKRFELQMFQRTGENACHMILFANKPIVESSLEH